MESRVCTKCGVEKPLTDFYGKQKMSPDCKGCRNKYLREYRKRPYVKEKERKRQKEYRAKPEAKERHRLGMAEWRKENPEKSKEAVAKYYHKNKDKLNQKRKDKYHNDPVFKAKVILREKKYKESGRRKECQSKPDQMEKARKRSEIRRSNPVLNEIDKKRMRKYRANHKEVLNEKNRSRILQLADSYIKNSLLIGRSGWAKEDITPELIEYKRAELKLTRLIRSRND